MSSNARELAMFNLAIDSKLRACDLTRLQVQDVCMGGRVVSRGHCQVTKRRLRVWDKSRYPSYQIT